MGEQALNKKITAGLILSWIFGGVFALVGIISIFSKELMSGVIMLIVAVIIIPPFANLVNKKWKIHLSSGVKVIVVITGFIIFGSIGDTSNVFTTQQSKFKKEQQVAQNIDATKEMVTVKQENKKQKTPISDKGNKSLKKTKSAQTSNETVSQKNAIRSARSYLNYAAFSYSGLVKQLEYEQFSHADAVYGANNSGADWNEQVVKSAKTYMEYSAFSRGGLIKQLKYEGFTQAQAEYGANAVGL